MKLTFETVIEIKDDKIPKHSPLVTMSDQEFRRGLEEELYEDLANLGDATLVVTKIKREW